ncbi:MAG: MBL fold metallo-hydrolase [Muribaculaceae bacterium]|nr:MBL fold metallo-hydrolase [Muribaculaceae bacterium]
MAGHKYKGYINDGKPLKIAFDVDGDDTPHESEAEKPAPSSSPHERVGKGLCFISFGSGSSGNCAYLGTPRGGVLIDAGIREPVKYHRKKKNPERQDALTLDQAFAELERNGVSPDMVKGVLLTHAHQDHMRCLYAAVSRCHCSVYCTMGVMSQMLQRCRISTRIRDHHVPIFKEIPFRILDMEITAFETMHDVKSVGFSIEYEGERFVVATDMGMITDRAAYYMRQANYLMLECNYDLHMLETGHYIQMLKDRVKSDKGHLDNTVAAQFVADNYHDGLQYVFMCHLSKDNNTEEIATATMRGALEGRGLSVGDGSFDISQRGRDVQIYALPRYIASSWFVLD